MDYTRQKKNRNIKFWAASQPIHTAFQSIQLSVLFIKASKYGRLNPIINSYVADPGLRR